MDIRDAKMRKMNESNESSKEEQDISFHYCVLNFEQSIDWEFKWNNLFTSCKFSTQNLFVVSNVSCNNFNLKIYGNFAVVGNYE